MCCREIITLPRACCCVTADGRTRRLWGKRWWRRFFLFFEGNFRRGGKKRSWKFELMRPLSRSQFLIRAGFVGKQVCSTCYWIKTLFVNRFLLHQVFGRLRKTKKASSPRPCPRNPLSGLPASIICGTEFLFNAFKSTRCSSSMDTSQK